MGIYDTSGVVLAALEYEKLRPEGTQASLKDNHVLKGYLVNTSAEARHIPLVAFTLFDKNGDVLRRKRLLNDAELAPGEKFWFEDKLSTSPESLRHIVIEHGSPFELKLR
jgi:hypothetical protein